MPRPKKPRGRPTKNPLPPKIDASPEEIAQAFFRAAPSEGFKSITYTCAQCGRAVNYPETVFDDGLCSECHAG